MKYVDEFRDGALARALAERIQAEADRSRRYGFMEFCGGHTHAISRYGVADLLPEDVRMVHGPGCPVCVLPIGRIDLAVELALKHGAIVCTYGDTMRVPASDGLSLTRAKARGGDIRMVYSAADALALAQANPQSDVVFFAIGFETTTPPTAVVIKRAAALGVRNFSVLCCHVLTPPAITYILESPEVRRYGTVPIDGFVGPAHVSIVIGSRPYEHFAEAYRKPVVIAGFEPLDVLQAILMLVRQVNDQVLVAEVFEPRTSFEWRGLGEVPYSALRLRPAYSAFDAEKRFALAYRPVPDHKSCECGAILRGVRSPSDCKLFATVCTPENPMGSCMVSSEGACAAHYTYGRFRDVAVQAA